MDRKKSIFFICVTLIIIALIYYVVKKFKERTSPSPSPPAQTDELSISDLKFTRTLNPDKSNSESEISGYTIEYDGGIDYTELSKNVTFTITWKNNIGFNNVVKGFKIEHFIRTTGNTFTNVPTDSKEFTDTTTQQVDTSDYKTNAVSMVSDGTYSVIGDNRFKIYVILKDGCVAGLCPTVELYDGLSQGSFVDTHNINVSQEELGATLEMTTPQSVTYIPVVSSDTTTSISADITKVEYNITNGGGFNIHGSQSIYLMPADPGNSTTDPNDSSKVEITDAETFFLKYTDGQYLLHDLNKGAWNNKSSRSTGCDDACHTRGEKDNRIYVAFYNKSTTTDNNTKTQLRKTDMGYGLGTDFISSDANGNLILVDMASQTSTVSQTEYNNSFWTFITASGSLTLVNGGVVYVVDRFSPTHTYYLKIDSDGSGGGIVYAGGTSTEGLSYSGNFIFVPSVPSLAYTIPQSSAAGSYTIYSYDAGTSKLEKTIIHDAVSQFGNIGGITNFDPSKTYKLLSPLGDVLYTYSPQGAEEVWQHTAGTQSGGTYPNAQDGKYTLEYEDRGNYIKIAELTVG